MSHTLRAVVKRALADRLMLATAGFVVVLATTLLAAGPIYADAVSLGGLQRTLELTPVDEANVEVAVSVNPADVLIIEDTSDAELARTFSPFDHDAKKLLISDSFQLPGEPGAEIGLAVFRHIEGIEEHAEIVAGRWPQQTTDEMAETAVSEWIADELDLVAGDELVLTNRRDPDTEQATRITGIYRPVDIDHPFWFNDPLSQGGATQSPSFTTYGPFVVTRQTLLEDIPIVNARLLWRVFIDNDAIASDDLSALERRLRGLEERLNGAAPASFSSTVHDFQGISVDTSLRPILRDTDASLTVTRSGVLMVTIQLSIMAGVALALTAGLLVESRVVETQVLRSRGATNGQMVRLALVEGALLTIPTALAAPWIAARALTLLNHIGPLASIGLQLDPKPNAAAYMLSLLAGVGCTLALAFPAYRSARRHAESAAARGRQRVTNEAQRTGLDLALRALAVVGFWQLSVHAETVSSSIRGRFGVDPLLVGAPAVVLIAGSLLALRVVPLLARTSELVARRTPSAVLGLTAWQLSRRPRRYTRAVLLLTIAICIGIFSLSYASTWSASGRAQADFEVGADVRAFPNLTQDGIGDLHFTAAIAALDPQQEATPVIRASGGRSSSDAIRRFVILDVARAAEVVRLRSDLGPDFADAMQELEQSRPTLATIDLPGRPRHISVSIDIDLEPLDEELELPDDARVCFCASAAVVLQDADGLLHRVELGDLTVDTGPQTLEADLVHRLADGSEVNPRYPLSLIAVEIDSLTPRDIERTVAVAFRGIAVSESPTARDWNTATADLDRASWDLDHTQAAGTFRQPSIALGVDADDALLFELRTGSGFGGTAAPVTFSIMPTGTDIGDAAFPIVTTTQLLERADLQLGDEIRLPSLDTTIETGQVVAAVTAFPTVDPTQGEAVLIDLPTYQMLRYAPGRTIPTADEYWISGPGSTSTTVAEALRAAPYNAPNVIEREEIEDRYQTDPIALATMGSLFIGFIAAVVFAGVGFAVSAAVSARERLAEFTVTRALGVSDKQLTLWVALEQGTLVLLSLAVGTLIGVVLVRIALPLISLSQSGSAPVPDVQVVIPLVNITVLEVTIAAFLTLVTVLLVRRLRRTSLDRDFRVSTS